MVPCPKTKLLSALTGCGQCGRNCISAANCLRRTPFGGNWFTGCGIATEAQDQFLVCTLSSAAATIHEACRHKDCVVLGVLTCTAVHGTFVTNVKKGNVLLYIVHRCIDVLHSPGRHNVVITSFGRWLQFSWSPQNQKFHNEFHSITEISSQWWMEKVCGTWRISFLPGRRPLMLQCLVPRKNLSTSGLDAADVNKDAAMARCLGRCGQEQPFVG